MPPDFPLPTAGVQTLMWSGKRIAVSLAGGEAADPRALRLSFVSRAEFERQLFDLDARSVSTARTWIITPPEHPDASELRRRAALCHHLLAIALGRASGPKCEIFELSARRLALTRIAVVEPPAQPLSALPVELRLVRHVDCVQLPLVSMFAELPGLEKRRTGYGLDVGELRRALTMDFFNREALLHALARGTAHAATGHLEERTAPAASETITAQQAAEACFGSSWASCVEQLVCAWARTARSGAGRQLDLLSIDPPSARVAVLQDVLRRRRASVSGALDDRFSPLLVFRSSTTVARLGFEEVVAETLLRAAAACLRIGDSGALACAPSLSHPATQRDRLRRALTRLPARLSVVRGSIRWLGKTAFFGAPTHS
jgi:hypothetical protein